MACEHILGDRLDRPPSQLIAAADPPLRHQFVDGFSLMTYDFNTRQPGGGVAPNAPLPWVRRCLRALVTPATAPSAATLLTGLNLYGSHYTSASIKVRVWLPDPATPGKKNISYLEIESSFPGIGK